MVHTKLKQKNDSNELPTLDNMDPSVGLNVCDPQIDRKQMQKEHPLASNLGNSTRKRD